VCFSPNGKYLLAGTSVDKETKEKQSYVHFYDTTTYEKIKTLAVGDSSVTGVCWS